MRTRLSLALLLCVSAALIFYGWQNQAAAPGGAIALPKALWLGLTVFYWLVLPPLVFSDHRTAPRLRHAYWVFWLPMLARAGIELWLLYGAGGWQYIYGIAHDAFSLLLLGALYCLCRRSTPRPWVQTLAVMAAMFAAEIYFALYISAFNHGAGQADLWFIGWEAPHRPNQLFTTACVLCLAVWLAHLWRATGETAD